MSAALWFRRCLGFCIGMCFSSLGLALITNTNLGTTPITSLPVALNALVPLSIGGYTVIVSVLFIQRAVKPLPSGGGYKAHLNWNFCL